MDLIGRDWESRAVRDALGAAGSGRAGTLLISGDVGLGKTRLAGLVADLAAERKMVVLTGRASPFESAPSLWPWFQVLAGRPERDLLPSAVDAEAVGEVVRARWEALERVAAALASSSPGTATVIILEDMHWADDSSLQLLQACAGRPGLLVAATFRSEVDDELSRRFAALCSGPDTTHLMLRPWTADEVAQAARHVDRSWAPLLTDGSEGNPLVVGEMLASLEQAGLGSTIAPGSWPLGVPARLADIVRHRVEGLDELSRAAVLAVYLLDEPVSPMQVAELTGLDAARVLEALAAGVARRLLTRVSDEPIRVLPTHELMRPAGYRLIDERTRLRLHRRVADLIEAGRMVGDHVAHRLRCIVDETDRDRALLACRAAAITAMDRLGFDRAVAVLQSALALPGLSPEVRSELLLETATAEYRRGAVDAALQCCEKASADGGNPELLTRAALVVRGIGGPLNSRIVGLCDRALEAIPPGALVQHARLLAQKALATGEVVSPVHTNALTIEALQLAESSGDPEAIMIAVHARHQALSGPDHTAERVTLAERMTALAEATHDPNTEMWGRLAQIDAAFELGQPAVVRENVSRLEVLADRLAWPLGGWHAHRLRAAIALLSGDFETTETETAHARFAARRTGVEMHTALLGLLDFQRLEHLGRLSEAVDQVRRFATGLGPVPVAWSNGGALLLSAGDRDGALDCYERLRPVLRHLPADGRWFFTVLGASELALAFDDADTAGWCYRTLLPYADRYQAGGGGTIICRGSVSRLLGALAAAAGELGTAATHLTAAVTADSRIGAVPFRALSQLKLAEVLARRDSSNDINRAHALLGQAATTMRRLCMTSALAEADALDASLRRAAGGSASLTCREQQVLALLASGASNRSIAASLVVSERTAEYHVANILTKIGAANRTEAATWALRTGLSTEA